MPRPQNNQGYLPYMQGYINCTKGNSIKEMIANHEDELLRFYNDLPEEKADYKYAADKWTVKEVLQHVIDTERVFVYRATSFARKDKNPLPGFDENSWALHSFGNQKSLADLKKEFSLLHQSTALFLAGLNDEQLAEMGSANNNPSGVNALAFIIYGHLLHHKNILSERYL
jgi:uncharacterized damage-inducible protein DinB